VRGLPKTPFGGLVAREIRYWWRHPRRRAGLISLLAASVVVPLGLRIGTSGTGGGFPLPFGMALAGLFIGLVLANQFGNDGTAYAMHLLVGVRGQAELRSRAIALAVLTLPLLVVGALAAALITDAVDQLPAAFGMLAAAFGTSMGVSGLTSVLFPYPMPDSTNPFAANSGSGSAKGFLSLVAMVVTFALLVPMFVGYVMLPDEQQWVLVPAGVAWGLVAGWAGTVAGGAVLDRRMPEVLDAVTPRR
jgi:ABC-2 type transport system permease protein